MTGDIPAALSRAPKLVDGGGGAVTLGLLAAPVSTLLPTAAVDPEAVVAGRGCTCKETTYNDINSFMIGSIKF